MLAPNERSTYFDALRPPDGFRLDRAIGTTFSLDLESLLLIPLGFAAIDWHDDRQKMLADPSALLDSLRRYAERTTVFCQEGRIALPAKHHPLYAHLERMVVEVRAQGGGVFHPKTWLLRFVAGTGEEQEVAYRFLCTSRNLTKDRSWDTMLALEGPLDAHRKNAWARNHPLGDFIASLPQLASTAMDDEARAAVERMADEARRVRFEAPEPFDEDGIDFVPIGIGRHGSLPVPMADRILVVSPFLSSEWLAEIEPGKRPHVLISRAESLDEIAAVHLEAFHPCLVLDDAALEEESEAEGAEARGEASLGVDEDTHGLHAKLFVLENGWDAQVVTGSANATTAAFSGRNVEFLVGLTGKRSKVGIDVFLEGGTPTLFSLLTQYTPSQEPVVVAPELKAVKDRLEALRRTLAASGLFLRIAPADQNLFDLVVEAPGPLAIDLSGLATRCWPVSLNANLARELGPLVAEGRLLFPKVSLEGITSFVAIELEARAAGEAVAVRFALNLPIHGMPANRMEKLLSTVLGSRERLLRFLLLLLADDTSPAEMAGELLSAAATGSGSEGGRGQDLVPLLEEMLRALARSPEKLDAVDRVIEDLKKTSEGAALIPEGFDAIWKPIWAARKEVR